MWFTVKEQWVICWIPFCNFVEPKLLSFWLENFGMASLSPSLSLFFLSVGSSLGSQYFFWFADSVLEYFLEAAMKDFVIGRVEQTQWHPDYCSPRVVVYILVKKLEKWASLQGPSFCYQWFLFFLANKLMHLSGIKTVTTQNSFMCRKDAFRPEGSGLAAKRYANTS